ncbi:MAG TPA: DUF2752 domain-containing protein [Thermoanaerobaculia bacterium]|nr:DUF2752 domain-containing protein [Thermoanaerobaculia bacterium]
MQLLAAPCAFAIVFGIAHVSPRSGFCVMRRLTGFPCPGCGVTTSVAALLRGDVRSAMRANVAGPFVLAFFVAQLALFVAASGEFLPIDAALRGSQISDRSLLCALLFGWGAQLQEATWRR